jgi:hypothetical protein
MIGNDKLKCSDNQALTPDKKKVTLFPETVSGHGGFVVKSIKD